MRFSRTFFTALLTLWWAAMVAAAAPLITGHSATRQVLSPGQNLALSVTAGNLTGPASYQWRRNGQPVGTNSSSYTVASVAVQDAGWYVVDVTDNAGTTRSVPLFVIVAPATTQLYGWGSGNSTEVAVPEDVTDAVAVAVGTNHALALQRGGGVRAWGNNEYEQTDVPGGLTGVVAISAANTFSLALKSDGTVVSWGAFNNNATAVDFYGRSEIPPGLTGVVAIAAGRYHVLALKSDGTVVAWGSNAQGECTLPVGLSGVVGIAVGNHFSVAVKSDGTVAAWGLNDVGQTSVTGGLTDAVAVASGASHTLALRSNGTVVAWGGNTAGQQTVPGGLSGVAAVAAGDLHSLARKGDGTVVAWGDNEDFGQSTVPTALAQVQAVAGGQAFSLAVRDAGADTTPPLPAASATVLDGTYGFLGLPVAATGSPMLRYQWYVSTASVPAFTALENGPDYFDVDRATLSIVNPGAMTGNVYRCRVFNAVGEAQIQSVLAQWGTGTAATVSNPSNQAVASGGTATFTVTAGGAATITYQWQIQQGGAGAWTNLTNSGAYSGVQSASLQVAGCTVAADHGDRFRCVVANASGGATSAAATLTVSVATQGVPVISSASSFTFGSAYTATANSGSGALEWALGTGSTAAGAAIEASTGAVTVTGVGLVRLKARFAGDAEHAPSAYTADFTVTVNPIATTFALSATSFTYTGAAQGPTISATPGAATFTTGGTLSATVAGDYTATATATGNYTGSNSSLTWSIAKATAGVTLGGLDTAFDGTARAAWGSPQGIVTTFSGTAGSPGSLDGTGAAALFNAPRDADMDSAGNIYVADSGNHTIRKITPAGVVSTFAGTALQPGSTDGTGSAARFSLPGGLAVDSSDNVYVADSGNHTIRKITPAGVVTTFAGLADSPGSVDGTGAAARFNQPADVAVDGTGNVYVADSYNHTIRKITPGGEVTTLAGLAASSGSTDDTGSAARFYYPVGLGVDGAGNVYVADSSNYVIRKVTPAGVVTTLAGSALSAGTTDDTGSAARFYSPFGVDVDAAGNVYVSDNLKVIRKITSAGVVTTLAGNPHVSLGSVDGTGAAARFNSPSGLVVDADGSIYVADTSNNQIRKVTAGGVVTTYVGTAPTNGSADGTGAAARYDYPRDVAVDGTGNVYVADSANRTIRKITPGGVVTTLAGTPGVYGVADGTGSAAQFGGPAGVAADSAGNVYVADRSSHTIRKITPGGEVTTLAGSPGVSGSADGTGSEARFYEPSGLAVDSLGNVYVADYYNYTIRKITPGGVVTTFAGTAGLGAATDGTGAAARFYLPSDVALDSSGNVYVADDHQVRKITPGAVVTTLAGHPSLSGETDGPGSTARFGSATGVAVDAAGNVFVADTGNSTIRRITPDGLVTTIAGSAGLAASTDGTGSTARFYYPRGLAVDGTGNLYVADTGNNIIRKITGAGGAVSLTYNGSSTVPTSAGSYTVVATLTDSNHVGTATGTLTIAKASQAAVTITSAATGTFGSAYTATATGGSGTGGITWSLGSGSTAPGAAINASSGAVTSTGAGTVVIRAQRAGDANYLASATTADFTITLGKAAQAAVTITSATTGTFGSVYTATATGGSGTGAITWSLGTGSTAPGAAIDASSGAVTSTGAGTVVIRAHRAGDANYLASAMTADFTVTLAKADQAAVTITSELSTVYPVAYTATATGGNGTGALVWSLGTGSTAPGAGINASTGALSFTGVGTVVIRVQRAGDTNYNASALSADFTVTVNKGPATVTLGALAADYDGTAKAATATTSPEGLAVTFTYNGSATAPTNPGSYTVVGTVQDELYAGNATGTLVITDRGPVVTGHSANRTVLQPGDDHTLSVTVAATGTPTYQWYHDGRVVAGATAASLPLNDVTYADQGAYWVVVTNTAGSTRSVPLFVLVAPATTEIWAWGASGYGQAEVPVGLNRPVAVSAGGGHSLALLADGTVVTWGSNNNTSIPVPDGLTDVVAIAAGDGFSVALKADGTVVAWGENSVGQTSVPSDLKSVAAIAAGKFHGLALKTDGTVVGWGANYYGALIIPTGLAEVAAISAGSGFSIALKADGTVVAWGADTFGQASAMTGQTGVVAADAGSIHSLALKGDGTLTGGGAVIVEGGFAGYMQTSPPPEGLSQVTAISAGVYHSLALKADRTVVAWGGYYIGTSQPPYGLTNVLQISAGSTGNMISLALRDTTADAAPVITVPPASQTVTEGSPVTFSVTATGNPTAAFQWKKGGVNIAGATGATYTIPEVLPTDAGQYTVVATNYLGATTSAAATLTVNPKPVIVAGNVREVLSPGHSIGLIATATGTGLMSYQWIHNGRPLAGATGTTGGALILPLSNVTPAAAGWYAVDVTDTYGTTRSAPFFVIVAPEVTSLHGWGVTTYNTLTFPDGLTDAVTITAGANHALALRRDGSVVAWGNNNYGEGTVPGGLSDVVALAAWSGSYALKSDGTVVGWGTYAPTVPAGLNSVVAISAGGAHALALKANGTVVAWGTMAGDPATVPDGLANVVAIAAGGSHALALKADGTVVAWGYNAEGQTTIPDGLADVVAIAAGNNSSFAVRADGTVVKWGNEPYTHLAVPEGLTQITALSIRWSHVLGLKSDRTVVAWGLYPPARTVPTDLPPAVAVAAGMDFSLALGNATVAPVISVSPQAQAVTVGQTASFTVVAAGTPAPTYRWQRLPAAGGGWANLTEGGNFTGTTTASLSVIDASLALHGDQFRCVVTNSAGAATSAAATLSVQAAVSQLVPRLYERVLGVAPTEPELAAELAALQAGGTLEQILTRLLASPAYLAREKERAIRLYYATFNRMPDHPGLYYWASVLASGAQSPTEVATLFAQSTEFTATYGELPAAAFIAQMYRNTLGRDPDQGGLNYWVGQMNAGLTRGQMLLAFADSQEFKDRMSAEVEVVRLYHLLLNRMPSLAEMDNWRGFLRGYDQTETILASSEFASVHPGGLTQPEFVDAVFAGFLLRAADPGSQSLYSGLLSAGSLTRPLLIKLITDYGEYQNAVVPVTRHYLSVFLRPPDLVGSTHWTNQMRAGLSLTQLSQVFAGSGEFANSYAGLSDPQFVAQMYLNILGRPADTGGLNHWVNLFATGQSDEAGLLLSFVQSAEAAQRFAAAIRTIGHFQAFYGRNPTEGELAFWKNYLDTLPQQFRQELLASEEFSTAP